MALSRFFPFSSVVTHCEAAWGLQPVSVCQIAVDVLRVFAEEFRFVQLVEPLDCCFKVLLGILSQSR